MKSLFANKEIILPSWLKILMETIDSETIQKLSENQEYRKMQIRRKELLEHYPIIEKVIDDEGKVSISEQGIKHFWSIFWLRIVWKMKNVCIIICMDISIAMNI